MVAFHMRVLSSGGLPLRMSPQVTDRLESFWGFPKGMILLGEIYVCGIHHAL